MAWRGETGGGGGGGAMIDVTSLTKSFGGMPVLRGVDLAVPEGCLYGLIGPGAAGKSVLLKMLTGLLRPDGGRVVVDGQDVQALSELDLQAFRTKFGMLFQNNALFDYLTVGENIAFPLRRLFNLNEDEIAARIAERLKVVSLPGFEDRMPSGLSGGQKKRVGVARATVSQGRIVLYDEPAAGLDPVTSQRIFELLPRGAARRRGHGGDGVERPRPAAHGHRPGGDALPGAPDLRRDDGGGEGLGEPVRAAVRARDDGGAALSSRRRRAPSGTSRHRFPVPLTLPGRLLLLPGRAR